MYKKNAENKSSHLQAGFFVQPGNTWPKKAIKKKKIAFLNWYFTYF